MKIAVTYLFAAVEACMRLFIRVTTSTSGMPLDSSARSDAWKLLISSEAAMPLPETSATQ